jgi:hypothetical protein
MPTLLLKPEMLPTPTHVPTEEKGGRLANILAQTKAQKTQVPKPNEEGPKHTFALKQGNFELTRF